MRLMRAIMVGIIVLGVVCSACYAKEARKMPILSCETYSLRDYFGSGKLDYLTAPKLFKEMGIPGICYNSIWMKSYDHAYLDSIKKACKDAGVKITGFIIEGNIATLDDDARRKQIDEDIRELKAAGYLGAPIVRINLGSAGSEAQDDTVGAQRCIDAFKEMLPLAKQLNIKLTIENHGGVSKKADTILKVIKGTDPKWVGACLDFGNWPADVRNSESAKLAPYAYHVHAKCHEFTPDGEAVGMDYKYLLGLLQKANYTGAVSIEFEGSGDQMEGVKKSMALIKKYWPGL
jgi:sugar phosphate isomerase/epimerase